MGLGLLWILYAGWWSGMRVIFILQFLCVMSGIYWHLTRRGAHCAPANLYAAAIIKAIKTLRTGQVAAWTSLLLGRVLFLFVIAVFLAAGAVAGAAAVPALFAVGNKTDGNAEQNKNNNQNKDTLK